MAHVVSLFHGYHYDPRGTAPGDWYGCSFDFKIILAPCRISRCSFGQTNSAFSKAALQIRKLRDRTTTSSWGPTSFTILKANSSIRRREQIKNEKSSLAPILRQFAVKWRGRTHVGIMSSHAVRRSNSTSPKRCSRSSGGQH